jgi:hypothetical protein
LCWGDVLKNVVPCAASALTCVLRAAFGIVLCWLSVLTSKSNYTSDCAVR